MTKTRDELVTRAVRSVGGEAAGQPIHAADYARVNDEIEPLMADLASRNIYQWGDPDQIDEDAFIHLAKLLGNSCADWFGKPDDEALRLRCEARLRQLQPIILSGQPQRAEYF